MKKPLNFTLSYSLSSIRYLTSLKTKMIAIGMLVGKDVAALLLFDSPSCKNSFYNTTVGFVLFVSLGSVFTIYTANNLAII